MAFLKYSLIRGGLFLAFFLLLHYLIPAFSPLTSALVAALLAFVVSYVFFRKQRAGATGDVAKVFAPNATTGQSAQAMADADAEDALIDERPDVWIDADRKSGTPTFDKE